MSFPIIQLTEAQLNSPNPAQFGSLMSWTLRVEVLEHLPDPISVRFVWVGSAHSCDHDQILDEFDVGPFPTGTSEFTLQCDGPNAKMLPADEVIGVTAMQVFFVYQGQPFLKLGYYAQVAYFDDAINTNPPPHVVPELLGRFLVMNQPSLVPVPIEWGVQDSTGSPRNDY